MGRGIALLFHDHGTRRGWVVSNMSRPHFTPEKDPVPIAQKAGWAPGLIWTGVESLVPTGIWPRIAQPVASNYTDWATQPTYQPMCLFILLHNHFSNPYLVFYISGSCNSITVQNLDTCLYELFWLQRPRWPSPAEQLWKIVYVYINMFRLKFYVFTVLFIPVWY